jgi:hypothetical protein
MNKKSLYKIYDMSDTEEVVLPRSKPQPKVSNTKPEIAREKLKEKRERLKKEKENMIIEEAKKRLASESETKLKEELIAKQQEEEKKKADPSYALMLKMEQMMSMFSDRNAPIAPGPIDEFRTKAKTKPQANSVKTKAQPKEQELPKPKQRASKKQIEIVQEEEEQEEEKPKRKPRAPKAIVDKPNKSPGLPKPRKKVVYLQQDPVPEESTQFVGYDIAPPAEPIQYQPSSGLLSALMGRRNMNSFNYYE